MRHLFDRFCAARIHGQQWTNERRRTNRALRPWVIYAAGWIITWARFFNKET